MSADRPVAAQRRILVVGVERSLFERLAPLLRRRDVDVDWIPSAEAALEIASAVRFDAIVLRRPLDGWATEDLVRSIRQKGTESSRAAILVLATPEELGGLGEGELEGVGRVRSLVDPPAVIERDLAHLLGAAPRVDLRVLARLEAHIDDGPQRLVCQTENLSVSGMLIRTSRMYPLGSELEFELLLPEGGGRVAGTCQVARHADRDREGLRGLGVRFLSLGGDSGETLRSFLGQLLGNVPSGG